MEKKESILAQMMTTKELAEYLKLHEITISKYAKQGLIPGIRIGRVWRFDKGAIDEWIGGGRNRTEGLYGSRPKATTETGKKPLKKKGGL